VIVSPFENLKIHCPSIIWLWPIYHSYL